MASDEMLSWLKATIEGDLAVARGSTRLSHQNGHERFWDDPYGTWLSGSDSDHIERQNPRDTIARCEAELVELDLLAALPHVRVHGDEWFSCAQAFDEQGELSCYDDARRGKACDCGRDAHVERLLEAKASGYRHRPGFKPEWMEG